MLISMSPLDGADCCKHKRWLEAGQGALYTGIKGSGNGNGCWVKLNKKLFVSLTKQHPYRSKKKKNPHPQIPIRLQPCTSALLHVKRHAWQRRCDLPCLNTQIFFLPFLINNENFNCNALSRKRFWSLILSVMNNTWLIKWTRFLWCWFFGGEENWTDIKKKTNNWQSIS